MAACLNPHIDELFFNGSTSVVGVCLVIVEASRSHSDIPHSVGLLWTSDRPVAETYTRQKSQHLQETDIPGRIRTAFPASERPQTHALDRAAVGVG